jgi:hypothetical protein
MEPPAHASEPAISPVPADAVPIASPQRERELAHRHEAGAPVPQPAAAAPQAAAPVQSEPPRVDLPTVSLTLPAGSDLVMVETTHHEVQPEPQTEAPRPRRVRPPRVEVRSEPLELVETRSDASAPGQ